MLLISYTPLHEANITYLHLNDFTYKVYLDDLAIHVICVRNTVALLRKSSWQLNNVIFFCLAFATGRVIFGITTETFISNRRNAFVSFQTKIKKRENINC